MQKFQTRRLDWRKYANTWAGVTQGLKRRERGEKAKRNRKVEGGEESKEGRRGQNNESEDDDDETLVP